MEFDLDFVAHCIKQTYWGQKRSSGGIKRSMTASFCVGAFARNNQVAFARAISDMEYHAFILDVFVVEEVRRNGIGTEILKRLLNHSKLSRVLNWHLFTKNQHRFYENLGFRKYHGDRYMNAKRAALLQKDQTL